MTHERLAAAMFALMAGCVTSGASAGPAGARNQAIIALRPVVARMNSAFEERERLVVRSEADWANLWSRAHAGWSPMPALPAVDFSREQLLVAAMGTRRSGGHRIEIRRAAMLDGQLEVEVVEIAPGANCVTTAAVTAPLVVVGVPRTEAPVVFVNRVAVGTCP